LYSKGLVDVKQSEKALVASCGGYCGECPFYYLAYVNNDEKLKKIEELSKQFNMEIKPDNIGCMGCHGSIRSSWCASCSIQQCTEEKGILTCAFCDEVPCEKLEKFYDEENKRYGDENRYGDESRAHILRQREIGLEKWLEEIRLSEEKKSQ
jgi:hypothetical protein